MADVVMVGLLPAFTIGRIACTVVSDHVGGVVDPSEWFAPLAMEYPPGWNPELLAVHGHAAGDSVLAWNLGLLELLYLIPVNVVILWIAFRRTKPVRAGLLAASTAFLYAPVRLALDFLRPAETDPRYLLLTFGQWGSLLVGLFSLSLLIDILLDGKPHAVAHRDARGHER